MAVDLRELRQRNRHEEWVKSLQEEARKACAWSWTGQHVKFRNEDRCIYCEPKEKR